MPAPSLVGAVPLLVGNKHMAIQILLKGLKGPINGKSYPSEMPSLASNNNGWVANVLSYARYEFGGNRAKNKLDSPQVLAKEVAKIRKDMEARNNAWTLDELKKVKDTSLVQLAKETKKK
jgi:hypothetical protein